MIRVLVVDDEPQTAAAHCAYVARCPGFEVVGSAGTAAEAREALAAAQAAGQPVDLMLLDMNLPDTHGLDLCRDLRSSGLLVDVLAVTAVRELDVVRGAVAVGIVQYLIKPFPFRVFADRMRRYRDYRDALEHTGRLTQHEVDRAIAALRTTNDPGLAKGLSVETLDEVCRELRSGDAPLSATEVGATLGLSRVTARRYLEHLSEQGIVERSTRRGARGRPEVEYRAVPGED